MGLRVGSTGGGARLRLRALREREHKLRLPTAPLHSYGVGLCRVAITVEVVDFSKFPLHLAHIRWKHIYNRDTTHMQADIVPPNRPHLFMHRTPGIVRYTN